MTELTWFGHLSSAKPECGCGLCRRAVPRECHQCGSRCGETPFPKRRENGAQHLCCDCLDERRSATQPGIPGLNAPYAPPRGEHFTA